MPANPAGYARTFIQNEYDDLKNQLDSGQTIDQIAESRAAFLDSSEVIGWIDSYNKEYEQDPGWFDRHPLGQYSVNASQFYKLAQALMKIEIKKRDEEKEK